MAGVFQNIDPPSPSPTGECVPQAFGAGGGHTRLGERGVGGSDTALYLTYVSTLCPLQSPPLFHNRSADYSQPYSDSFRSFL
jgi:hypothetical protein